MKLSFLAVAVCLLVILGAGCDRRGEPFANTAVNTGLPAPTVSLEGWRAGVFAVLEAYDEKHDAAAARDALVALRVPGQARDTHLALVLAFSSLADGDASATARLEEARAAFQALP